jgi:hypothetical protein|tara:strand:+ start:5946 stop:6461 length:516 start_codon:yes stop_codon:yes gene_type:complete
MTIVWLNGASRKGLEDKFPLQDIEIGCNYIRRDRKVNHVIAFDQPIVKALSQNLEEGVKYYTRSEWGKPGQWITVKQWKTVDPMNSGMMALLLATRLSKEDIYILGMDWGLSDISVYDYGKNKESIIKYTNGCKRQVKTLSETHKIIAVHNGLPDIDIPIIDKQTFLVKFK